MIIQNNIKVIRAKKTCSYIVIGYRLPINSRYVVQSFCSLGVKIGKLQVEISSFPSSFISNRTQPRPIKAQFTAKKNGWFVLGNVSVTSFVIEVLVC